MMVGYPTIVTIYYADGVATDVRAFTTATPGLVIHESLGDPGWCVSHERSGLFVCMFDDPEQAQGFAAALSGAVDWTQSGQEIQSSREAIERVRSASLRFNYTRSTPKLQNRQVRTERMTA